MTIRPLVLVCIVVFAVAMLGVRFAAHGIVDNFGTIGGLAVIAAMYRRRAACTISVTASALD